MSRGLDLGSPDQPWWIRVADGTLYYHHFRSIGKRVRCFSSASCFYCCKFSAIDSADKTSEGDLYADWLAWSALPENYSNANQPYLFGRCSRLWCANLVAYRMWETKVVCVKCQHMSPYELRTRSEEIQRSVKIIANGVQKMMDLHDQKSVVPPKCDGTS